MHVFDKIANAPQAAAAAVSKSFLSPEYVENYTPDFHRNYINALGTVSGIIVSLFTNFLIDAPLTQILTNRLYKNINHSSQLNAKNPSKSDHKNLLKYHLALNGAKRGENTDKKDDKISFKGRIDQAVLKSKYANKFTLKNWFWNKVANDPGKMLMHTGAIGWAASSAAQITGLVFNKKIDKEKKKFLIPQEFADAAVNITLYYLLTLSVKNTVGWLFESGKIRIKSVMDRIEKEAEEKSSQLGKDFKLGNIFSGEKSVAEMLEPLTKSRNTYLAHKNGACILATILASVVSCNILTPILRNIYGAYRQDMMKEKNQQISKDLFSVKLKSNLKETEPEAFKNFVM